MSPLCRPLTRFEELRARRNSLASPFFAIHLALPRAFVLYLSELRIYDIIILRRVGPGGGRLLGWFFGFLSCHFLVDLGAYLLKNSCELVTRRFYLLSFLS